ncbi:MAG: hypothetical protein WD005_00450 [Haliea sp.]
MHGGAMHQAAKRQIIILSGHVLSCAVVPHQHITGLPFMMVLKLGLDNVKASCRSGARFWPRKKDAVFIERILDCAKDRFIDRAGKIDAAYFGTGREAAQYDSNRISRRPHRRIPVYESFFIYASLDVAGSGS